MSRLRASLYRLIGRVKKVYSNILFQFGAVLIPISVMVILFALEFFDGWRLIGSAIVALIIFAMGAGAFKHALNAAKLELDITIERDKENKKMFARLINEIRALQPTKEESSGTDESG